MSTKEYEGGSIRNPSRVPRYQRSSSAGLLPQGRKNLLKVGGFCDFQVKPLPWKRWSSESNASSLGHCRVATEFDMVKGIGVWGEG